MGLVTLIAVVSEADADPSRLIASLRRQTDPNWELIVVDSTAGGGRHLRAGRSKHRVRIMARPDVAPAVGAAQALGEASGDLVGFVSPSDVLAPAAVGTLAGRASAEVELVYSDEDRIGADGECFEPLYKPGWSPDRRRCQPYTGRLTLVRRDLVDEVGGVHAGAGSAYEWDLVLRAGERARRVEHVAEVLCNCRVSADDDDRDLVAERRVIEDHLDRTGLPATVEFGDDSGVWRLRPRLQDEPLAVSYTH